MKPKREKYSYYEFDLKDCKIQFNIIGSGKQDPGYGTVFMNVTFPDKRWVAFKIVEGMRIPMYRDKKEAV
jgi:hypothetical protein